MTDLAKLKVKVFADGADKAGIIEIGKHPLIKGFTTNPTLMRKAGITDYEKFSREILEVIGGRPISYEVFADDFAEMERQARLIATWGKNVYVKVPVTNTKREKANAMVERLAKDGIQLNVTALMTLEQVKEVTAALKDGPHSYISVFAGRIADTGLDPVPLMTDALKIMKDAPKAELIWASPRELLNIFHADSIGCHVIAVTNDILAKLKLVGKDLSDFSLDGADVPPRRRGLGLQAVATRSASGLRRFGTHLKAGAHTIFVSGGFPWRERIPRYTRGHDAPAHVEPRVPHLQRGGRAPRAASRAPRVPRSPRPLHRGVVRRRRLQRSHRRRCASW